MTQQAHAETKASGDRAAAPDWKRTTYLLQAARCLDEIEEQQLLKRGELFYQFSARGHDMAQIMLGTLLNHPHDAVSGYYRSRPMMLSLGLSLQDAAAGPLMREGGLSSGRDIGVVFNMPSRNRACALPMAGGVGTQFTPIAGWAQAVDYRREVLGESRYQRAIGVALAGDAACATGGFWSALTIATTQKLPMLFYVEDNGFGISVTSDHQTPSGNIAANLASFKALRILDGDGTVPEQVWQLARQAVAHVRCGD